MKKISVFLAVSMMLVMLCPMAVLAEDGVTTAAYGTPVVDGEIDAVWATTVTNDIALLKEGNDTGLTATWKGLWDKDYFYVLIEVKDAHRFFEGSVSIGDSVEIYLDPLNLEADAYTIDEVAFVGVKGNDAGNFSIDSSTAGAIMLEETMNIVPVETKDGFIYEASFKFTEFTPDIKMAEGTTIAFDIQVNDKTSAAEERTAAYGWADEANAAWQYPYVLGKVNFVGGAPVEEVPAETEAPAVEETEAPAVEETEAPAVEEVPAETEAPAEEVVEDVAAPQTNDALWVVLALAVVSALGLGFHKARA